MWFNPFLGEVSAPATGPRFKLPALASLTIGLLLSFRIRRRGREELHDQARQVDAHEGKARQAGEAQVSDRLDQNPMAPPSKS